MKNTVLANQDNRDPASKANNNNIKRPPQNTMHRWL